MYHQITSNKRKSVIVVIGFLAVWLLAGLVIGEIGTASTSGAIVGTVVLGLLGVGAALYAYYLGAPTVLSAMGAHEADPGQFQQLYNIVQTLAIGDGLPMPKVYVIDDPSPNAFATGRDPQHAAVTVTAGLLQTMNREELEGVLSHEMSHIKNYDVRLLLVVTTMIGLAAIISSIFWRGALRMNFRGRNSGQAMLIIFAVGIIFTLIAFLVGPLIGADAQPCRPDQCAEEDRRQRQAAGEVQPRGRGDVHRQPGGAPWQLLQPLLRDASADRGADSDPRKDSERSTNLNRVFVRNYTF